jgi:phosphotransferase system  glucose/maltose/N-acetylglucosamine-specific IIC component
LATSRVAFDGRRARFLIDTGAAISVIDSSAAARLRLQAVGRSTSVAGAVCRGIVTPVLVHGWSFASEHLRQGVIGRSADVLPVTALRAGIVGIVGMATLARFGAVTIDYTHGRMVLGGTTN